MALKRKRLIGGKLHYKWVATDEFLTDPYAVVEGILGPGEGIDVDADGETVTVSSSIGWTDLKFPVQGVNPAGTAQPPSVDTNLSNFPGTLLFAGNAQNIIAGIAQMPHEWVSGTENPGEVIKPHIHWSKPTGSTAAVTWHFYYRLIGNPGDEVGPLVGPIQSERRVGNQAHSDEHLIDAFGEIDMTGYGDSTIIWWRVDRRGDTDAESNSVRLLEFDIHYRRRGSGSAVEYPGATG